MENKTTLPFLEYLDHTADILVHVKAKSLNNLFETSAEGLLNYAYKIKHTQNFLKHSFSIKEKNLEILFVKFLQTFIEILYCDNLIVKDVCVNINEDTLFCEYCAGSWDLCNRLCEVKGIAFSKLKIVNNIDNYEVYFIMDI